MTGPGGRGQLPPPHPSRILLNVTFQYQQGIGAMNVSSGHIDFILIPCMVDIPAEGTLGPTTSHR